MKGSVELLSTAMKTIYFEAIFVNYVQFRPNFHSFKLRLSLDTDLIHILQLRKYCLLDEKPFLEF